VSVSAAIEKAKKGEVQPVYLVGGEERWYVAKLCDAVRVATVGNGPRGFAEDLFDGRGTTANTVITACRTLPMMAKRRLVTVRSVEQMRSEEQEALVPYLAKPEPTAVLLLVATELDKRRKLALEAKKLGCLYEAEHPNEAEAAKWITREATARGVTLEPGAVESLTLALGGDLGQLADAIERLALYTNNGNVSAKIVDLLVTPTKEAPAFDLGLAVARRRRSEALALTVRLLNEGQDALQVLGLLSWQMSALARAKELSVRPREGVSPAAVLKMRPDRVAQTMELGSKWSGAQLQRAFRLMEAADLALKGGRKLVTASRGAVLVELVLALCGAPGLGEPSG